MIFLINKLILIVINTVLVVINVLLSIKIKINKMILDIYMMAYIKL